MSFTMEDNLESEWVSVRPKVFDEKERHKFVFIVAWNDIEGKFAITCHNRTVQRRSTLLDLDVPTTTTTTTTTTPTAAELLPAAAEKRTKSPVKTKTDEVCQAGKVRPHSVPKGKPSTKAVKVCTSNTSDCVGSWDIVTPKQMDMEILDPVDVTQSQEDSDPGESDSSTVHEDFSWAGLFSFQDLRAVHLQLCAVNSDLEPCLPSFPEDTSGMWTVLFGAAGVSQRETDALCYQLQVYLGHALDTCGWKILSQVLFSEADDTEEYYESLSELRQKGYEDALERAKRRMQEVINEHSLFYYFHFVLTYQEPEVLTLQRKCVFVILVFISLDDLIQN
uniref:JMY/WHAMM N-terminal domain-containing protein n=1 Tax=Labrus bergylta TaxID=56723 RepID=A0A3Q3E562_9LABR